jgi:hypothetical protein
MGSWKRCWWDSQGPVSGHLQLPRVDERLVTGAMDAGAMRPARLGLIGAVLLVALHAFLFASGEGHHSDPVPASSIAEHSAVGDGSGTVLRSSIQAHDMADSCMPAIVGLGVLLLGLAGGRPRHPAPVVLGWPLRWWRRRRHPRWRWGSPEAESTSGATPLLLCCRPG